MTLTFAAPTLAFETMFPTLILTRHQVRGTDLDGRLEHGALAVGRAVPASSPGSRESRSTLTAQRAPTGRPTPARGAPALPRPGGVPVLPGDEGTGRGRCRGEVDRCRCPAGGVCVEQPTRDLDGIEVTVRPVDDIWEHLDFQFGENNPQCRFAERAISSSARLWLSLFDRQAIAGLGASGSNPRLPVGLDPRPARLSLPPAPGHEYRHDPEGPADCSPVLCAELGRDCDTDPPAVVFSTTSNGEERPAFGRSARRHARRGRHRGCGLELRGLQPSSSALTTWRTESWDLAMWAWAGRSPDRPGCCVPGGLRPGPADRRRPQTRRRRPSPAATGAGGAPQPSTASDLDPRPQSGPSRSPTTTPTGTPRSSTTMRATADHGPLRRPRTGSRSSRSPTRSCFIPASGPRKRRAPSGPTGSPATSTPPGRTPGASRPGGAPTASPYSGIARATIASQSTPSGRAP